jgi:hypothetical protein
MGSDSDGVGTLTEKGDVGEHPSPLSRRKQQHKPLARADIKAFKARDVLVKLVIAAKPMPEFDLNPDHPMLRRDHVELEINPAHVPAHWALHPHGDRTFQSTISDPGLRHARSYRYELAVDEQLRETTPMRGICRPNAGNEDARLGLDARSAERLLEHAQERSDPVEGALVVLLLLRGLRISEALSLRAGDITLRETGAELRILRKGRTAPHVRLPTPRRRRARA